MWLKANCDPTGLVSAVCIATCVCKQVAAVAGVADRRSYCPASGPVSPPIGSHSSGEGDRAQ
eukprot:1227014-Lingulodinium_polyedra.AAC.1